MQYRVRINSKEDMSEMDKMKRLITFLLIGRYGFYHVGNEWIGKSRGSRL